MQNTAVCTATTPEVQDALDVNVLGKLGTYTLMLQRILLMIFKGKGYFESYQCIWLKINLHETIKKESKLP